jgi:hypothetical protein
MPFGTGDDVKSGIVYEWLRGSSRDKISRIYNISTGGVTNIINEWRNNIGAYIAEDLRELSISLKKANITSVQCSTGTTSNIQKTILEQKLNSLADSNNISREAVTWYKNIKNAFSNAGISIDNVSTFIHCLNLMKREGYDINKILMKFAEYENVDDLQDFHQTTMDINKSKLEALLKEVNTLQEQKNLSQLKLSEIQQLKNMGIGIKELKTLYDKITEIATETNIPPNIAMDKLLNNLEDYDYILRFKNTLEKMEQELSNLSIKIENQRRILASQPYTGSLLQNLLGTGLTEQDILEINSILLSGGFDLDHDNNNNIVNKQSLIADLKKYRNIKLVTKELELKNKKLSKTILESEYQKKILENYLNLILAIIYNIGDLQSLLKKVNIALEYPKILLIYLFSDSNKQDNNKDLKDNNAE